MGGGVVKLMRKEIGGIEENPKKDAAGLVNVLTECDCECVCVCIRAYGLLSASV